MMTADLTGALLDYWVAHADESWNWAHVLFPTMTLDPTFKGAMYDGTRTNFYGASSPACFLVPNNPFRQDHKLFAPSTYWEHGGPIIERERIGINLHCSGGAWGAWISSPCYESNDPDQIGHTPLIAAMRAIVARKFGNEVPDPDTWAPGTEVA